MVAHQGLRFALACAVFLVATVSSSSGDTIRFDLNNVPDGGITPGSSFSVLMLISDPEADTSLFGYTLEVDIDPDAGTTGVASADIGATNFFNERNVIVQGGEELNPLWSLIRPTFDMDSGVFIQALTSSFGSVPPPIAGVSDVLAEIWINVDEDAEGSFTIDLNAAASSVTAEIGGSPSIFLPDVEPFTFNIVPEPAAVWLLACGAVFVVSRGRRHGRGRGAA